MLNYIEYLGIPLKVALVMAAIFFGMQIIGEFLEFKGKVVPEIFKVRKMLRRKKEEKAANTQMMKDMKEFLSEVKFHYSEDNIAKRDAWMKWVNDRAEAYDRSIDELTDKMEKVTDALRDNTKLTEEMFVQQSRDRIIDFATKVSDESILVSKEEFNRIIKVYEKYEKFLEEHEMTNGEIDINYQIIEDAYTDRMHRHAFIEDLRGYKNRNGNATE